MYRSFYEGMTLAHLPLFALCVFMTVFVAVIVRVYVFQKRDQYDALSRLPLEDKVQP